MIPSDPSRAAHSIEHTPAPAPDRTPAGPHGREPSARSTPSSLTLGAVAVLLIGAVGGFLAWRSLHPAIGQEFAAATVAVRADTTLSPVDIAARARQATVEIRALAPSGVVIGQGTGFFVTSNGWLATNVHVIRGASALEVETSAGAIYRNLEFLAADPTRDIALLRVPIEGGRSLPLGPDTALRVGEAMYAMGNPLGQTGTFSNGLLSSIRAFPRLSLLQITAPVSPGSSGGPVMNARGEVVGVATLSLTRGQNLNYAVPVRYLRPLMAAAQPGQPFRAGLVAERSIDIAAGNEPSDDRVAIDPAPRERPARDVPQGVAEDDAATSDLLATIRAEIRRQFLAVDSVSELRGYTPVSGIVFDVLSADASKEHEATLRAGVSYLLVGECDNDCSDLDLALFDAEGTPVARDSKVNASPILALAAPTTGSYRVRVTMAACSTSPCFYGVRLYRRP